MEASTIRWNHPWGLGGSASLANSRLWRGHVPDLFHYMEVVST